MIESILGGSFPKYNGELLSAAAKRLSPAAHLRDPRGHHAQNLVAGIVTIGVVEFLEVVDIDDRDRILLIEREQRVVERAPAANAGEFVVVGENIGRLDEGSGQNEGSGGDVRTGCFPDGREFEPDEHGCNRPCEARFGWPAILQITANENCDRSNEEQEKPGRNLRNSTPRRYHSAILWPAKHGHQHRLKKQQDCSWQDSSDDQPALAHQRERDEVDRDEHDREQNRCVPGSAGSATNGEEFHRAVGKQQR